MLLILWWWIGWVLCRVQLLFVCVCARAYVFASIAFELVDFMYTFRCSSCYKKISLMGSVHGFIEDLSQILYFSEKFSVALNYQYACRHDTISNQNICSQYSYLQCAKRVINIISYSCLSINKNLRTFLLAPCKIYPNVQISSYSSLSIETQNGTTR